MTVSNQQNILIISLSNLKTDPRVYRQIIFLTQQKKYNITTAGLKDPEINGVEFCLLTSVAKSYQTRAINVINLKIKNFEQYYWSDDLIQDALQKLEHKYFDLIIANDIHTLPLALKLAEKNNSKVLLDAHEYMPRFFECTWFLKFLFQEYWDYICRQYLSQVDAMITVCPGIAEEYQKVYGVVECDILTNAPFYDSLNPSQINHQEIRMVHHGSVNKSRKIEKMIYLMDFLDERFTLDFMLVSRDKKYLDKLQQLASSQTRIKFRDPVPMPEISEAINEYDIGLYLLDAAGFNNRMALPNKLFEYIQGRLAIAIWPSPEMARIVKEYNCGVVSENFTIESMAEVLNNLSTEDIHRFKQNSHQAASTLCAETNRQILLEKVQELID